jgi:bacteriocin-like protein
LNKKTVAYLNKKELKKVKGGLVHCTGISLCVCPE